MTKALTKSKQNVQDHGEVFTPKDIVLDMLNQFPQESWEDPTTVFLEHSCGNGNFVLEIIKKRLQSGLSLEQAVNTVFGLDISQENIQECHNRIYKASSSLITKISSLVNLIAITRNNIFVVDDSLRFLREDWKSYPFFHDRPEEYQKEQKKRIRKEIMDYFERSNKKYFQE